MPTLSYLLVLFVAVFLEGFALLSAVEVAEKYDDIPKIRYRREVDDPDPVTRIREFLRRARTESGDVDLNMLLAESVNDPVPLESFNISSSGFITDIFGQFTDLYLHGLKGFQVDQVSMNLSKMNLSAKMSLPILSIVGQYFLDGTFTFLPISGQGPFWMNLSSIDLSGHSLIRATPEGKLTMEDIKLDSEVGDIALHFENLMGGGAWGSISNSMLNQLSELILGELKHILLGELSSYLKYQFDNVLFDELPEGFMDPTSTSIVDSLLNQASEYMVNNGLEPLPLKEYKEVYERNLFFVTTRGELKLFNGTLHGLSTMSRDGDVLTVYANNSLIFEADFGFGNLTGNYSWLAEVFGAGTQGTMEIKVKSVEGFIRVKQRLSAGSKLELDTLYIKDIQHVWLDLHGLGRWDYVMESIVNLVANGLKLQLADAIAEPVKKGVQQHLDLLNIGVP